MPVAVTDEVMVEQYRNGELVLPEEIGADGLHSGVELEESAPFPFDADKISISNIPVTMETLLRRLKQASIESPPFQRGAGIWDDGQQSRLMESLMLKIPLPMFYVAADEHEVWKIVDGLQRVTAMRRFIQEESYALTGLEFIRELEGKKFSALSQKFQNRILETVFQFAVINPSTPPNVQRNVFKRLNTGGMPLSQQEIRHALYYGASAKLLEELARSEAFKKATVNSIRDTRMAARELVLRFLAFLIRDISAYPKSEDMDSFLCETMQLLNSMGEKGKSSNNELQGLQRNALKYTSYEALRESFNIAMFRAGKLFGEHAFRKSLPGKGAYRTPINKSLFECWSVLLAELPQGDFAVLLARKKRLIDLLHVVSYKDAEETFTRAISRDSHKPHGVNKRYEILRKTIAQVLAEEKS